MWRYGDYSSEKIDGNFVAFFRAYEDFAPRPDTWEMKRESIGAATVRERLARPSLMVAAPIYPKHL